MEKRWNINSFLCESADENVTNIKNIFDTLRVKKNGSTSFTIVTILNGFQCDESNFRLYYFIEQMGNDKMAYLGNSYFEREAGEKQNCNENKKMGRVEESVSMMIKAEVLHMDFPASGQYELQVYKYDNEEAEDIDGRDPEEQGKWSELEHLVATYPFGVNIIEE